MDILDRFWNRDLCARRIGKDGRAGDKVLATRESLVARVLYCAFEISLQLEVVSLPCFEGELFGLRLND